jgi:predicted acetyltransferase
VAVYRLSEEGDDFTKHELELHYLVSETTDAYAALWRFVLEHDLVSVVKAPLRSVDEPLRWMIADQRGATVETTEHGWLRILDVPAVLAARTYAAPSDLTLGITDSLGFAHGVWHLEVDDEGTGVAEPIDASPDVAMGVGELSSILLGGVRALTLHAAGRVQGSRDAVAALDRGFASTETPYLSLWYLRSARGEHADLERERLLQDRRLFERVHLG